MLGVPRRINFSNPGPKDVILLKGKVWVWSEDGTTLVEMDQKHQMEAQRREVVIKHP